ncbi:MAG: hypothetical protein Q9163_005102 [Psora crenata]
MVRFVAHLQFLPLLLTAFTLVSPVVSVKHENFKTCEQSGFCMRNRAYADTAASLGTSWTSPYILDGKTLEIANGHLTAILLKSIGEGQPPVELPLTIRFQEPGVARVSIDELKRQKGDIKLRHDSHARKERYNEVEKWATVGGVKVDTGVVGQTVDNETIVSYGPGSRYKAIIKHEPFAINFLRDEQVQVKLNSNGLMNMEHWRPKVDKEHSEGEDVKEGEEHQVKGEDESTWWEESFGGSTDSKPKGPESVGMDITFPEYEHVYGIPGHAGPLSLRETRGASGSYNQPYRLYNSDVFEYEMDTPMALYGAIPLMHAHRKDSTVGVFWMNAAETWIDIVKEKQSSNPLSLGLGGKADTKTHWYSESGLIDIYVFLGPEPKDVLQQYGAVTGYTQLPQHFAIAYHQCRWNYVTDEDVKDVDKKMSKYRIPYDVIWLDIEYTDGKKYFTWDEHTFPDPLGMQKQLDASQRKLVAIIDPHIKNEANYPVVDALKQQDLAVKNKDNAIYEGWCWPGSSYWVDCFNPLARKWWTSLFTYKAFTGSAPNMFLWNDMNEPSVFNGPDTTMPRDNLHHGNWEHRDVHNLNGLTFHNATYEALRSRDNPPKRPFVLTRSFYSGSQRLGAMWTGDNQAAWPHLAASIPMILSMNMVGYPFAGADIGGFFLNPSKELLTRWYQAGAFYPFMRAHAHIDTRRREPYLAGEPYVQIITQALRLRYQLLPAWYTAFHIASTTGAPIIRPHFYVHPSDVAGFALEDQFYLGDTGILAKPVVTEGAESVDVYLPAGYTYYDYFTFTPYTGAGRTATIIAPLDKVPVLMQEGHIIPRKDRPRRSSGLMKWDPYTLVVVLDKDGKASGSLYIDDGETFDYQSGAFIHRRFEFSSGQLSSSEVPNPQASTKVARQYLKSMGGVRVEKITVVNAPNTWAAMGKVGITEDGKKRTAEMAWFKGRNGSADWAVVKNPGVAIRTDWAIDF